MGLAAGQARLLTITGRKSDCEYQSMKLSHQKIALARELADLSNEYQNSLDQSKLVYDYYGKGDTSTPLSYGILMNPSALNDYMPITVTDSMGRITLNSKYAAVAEAAGIPQEGLGTLPSEDLRNKFIKGLVGEEIITEDFGNRIEQLPYNQNAGFGGDVTVATQTTTGNYNYLLKYIQENCTDTYNYKDVGNIKVDAGGTVKYYKTDTEGNVQELSGEQQNCQDAFTLSDLLTKNIGIVATSEDKDKNTVDEIARLTESITNDTTGLISWLEKQFSNVLNVNSYSKQALSYATQKLTDFFNMSSGWKTTSTYLGDHHSTSANINTCKDGYKNYLGFVRSDRAGRKNRKDNAACGLSLSNIAQAYLTYFADYMNGVSKVDEKGTQIFDVKLGQTINSHFAKNNTTYQYVMKTGTSVSSDDMAIATFYDSLFNQICANGWTKNEQIEDKTYLQQMLQNGMLYLSKAKDDGYYYQENYATDSYIKEVTDDTKVAQAEAKYTTEKAKLNAKEETLDLKMKNLDTEISSLTTEYDTVKNTISKNIEKSFKRYNA